MKFFAILVFVAIFGLANVHCWEHYDHHDDHHYSHPKYEFKYGVKDTKTGDIKDQWEHRDGGHVKGAYTLKESDGTTRIVQYHADGKTGFHADVKRIGHAHHPEAHHADHYNHGGWEGAYHQANPDQDHGGASSYIKVHHY